ncbi:MAG: hypothetical protein LCH63_16735 [Candidatus Melainabacteria bacterium]|nr:hypothetical protein [Candidatus Melainabacteria bacterium]
MISIRMRNWCKLLVVSLCSLSLSGCSLFLKQVLNPDVKETPVEVSEALKNRVLREERGGWVRFKDNQQDAFEARLLSAFSLNGKDYVVATTTEGVVPNQILVLAVKEPYKNGTSFEIIYNKKEFQDVTAFLSKHKSLIKGNLKHDDKTSRLKEASELKIKSIKLEGTYYEVQAVGERFGTPFEVKISILKGMEPALLPDGAQNPKRLLYRKAVKIESLGGVSDPFIDQLTSDFQIIDGTDKMNQLTTFECWPWTKKSFDIMKDEVDLRLFMMDKGRSTEYTDWHLIVNVPAKILKIKADRELFRRGLVRSLSVPPPPEEKL